MYAQNSVGCKIFILKNKEKIFDTNTIIKPKVIEFFESMFPKRNHANN